LNIYVGNLPLDINEDEGRQEFKPFGTIASIRLMDDQYLGSGHPRVYGFVEMSSPSECLAAISGLQGTTMRSQVLEIIGALPLSKDRDGGLVNARKIRKDSRTGRQRTRQTSLSSSTQ
jgi:RNA recognition motif-containing protein